MKARTIITAAAGAVAALGLAACAAPGQGGRTVILDLTHTLPMFAAKGGDVSKADLSKPFKDSKPLAGFGFQSVRVMKKPFKTKVGSFHWGWFTFDEHYGTHIDATDHYQNTPATLDVAQADNRSVEQYTVADITGPVVFIDISQRVQDELGKNGNVPSPDPRLTNFKNDGPAALTAADIAAVEDQIVDRAWVVVRTGWDKFYVGASKDPFAHPYINGFNYPGFHKGSIDKLIEIEKRKGVHINGLVMDNFTIDSGASGLGSTSDPFGDGWYAHNKGLQRGWKFVENAANLGQLVVAQPRSCTLIVGALKLTSATGSPVRLLAICQRR